MNVHTFGVRLTKHEKGGCMEDEVEYEILVDDEFVASVNGPKAQAKAEALHYAMMYGQDGGKVTFRQVIRLDVEFDK